MSRVAKRVQIVGVDLLGAHFEREDDGPIPKTVEPLTPEIGISAEWQLGEDGQVLGCVITFGTIFDGQGPYSIVARLRLLYSLEPGDTFDESDLEQFVYWNAVFNAWPYWREYVSSTIDRAHLPQFVVPVMRVPR